MAFSHSAGYSALSPDAVTRWGNLTLRGALGAGLVVTLALAWVAPAYLPLLIGGLVALPVLAWLFQHPTLNLVVVLAGFSTTLTSDHGIQPSEIAYGLYYYLFLLHWYGQRKPPTAWDETAGQAARPPAPCRHGERPPGRRRGDAATPGPARTGLRGARP